MTVQEANAFIIKLLRLIITALLLSSQRSKRKKSLDLKKLICFVLWS